MTTEDEFCSGGCPVTTRKKQQKLCTIIGGEHSMAPMCIMQLQRKTWSVTGVSRTWPQEGQNIQAHFVFLICFHFFIFSFFHFFEGGG